MATSVVSRLSQDSAGALQDFVASAGPGWACHSDEGRDPGDLPHAGTAWPQTLIPAFAAMTRKAYAGAPGNPHTGDRPMRRLFGLLCALALTFGVTLASAADAPAGPQDGQA